MGADTIQLRKPQRQRCVRGFRCCGCSTVWGSSALRESSWGQHILYIFPSSASLCISSALPHRTSRQQSAISTSSSNGCQRYAFLILSRFFNLTKKHSSAAVYSDPNFPLTEDGRVHHLNVKPGQGTSISASARSCAQLHAVCSCQPCPLRGVCWPCSKGV